MKRENPLAPERPDQILARIGDHARQWEKVEPHPATELRELEGRIDAGHLKIGKAMANGASDATLAGPAAKLRKLQERRDQLVREFQIPGYCMSVLLAFQSIAERYGWPMRTPAVITISVPGIYYGAIELPAKDEVPF